MATWYSSLASRRLIGLVRILIVLALVVPLQLPLSSAPPALAGAAPPADSDGAQALNAPPQEALRLQAAMQEPGAPDDPWPRESETAPPLTEATGLPTLRMSAGDSTLHAGEAVTVTASVRSHGDGALSGLRLELLTPPMVTLAGAGAAANLAWDVPALAAGEEFTVEVRLAVAPEQTLPAAAELVATVSGPDVGTVTQPLWLGVLPAARLGAAAAAGDAVATQTGAGTALVAPAAPLKLIVPAAAAPVATDFSYTPGFDWRTADAAPPPAPAPTPSPVPPGAAADDEEQAAFRAFLPIVAHSSSGAFGDVAAAEDGGETASPAFPNEEILGSIDAGVKFYSLWDLNAHLPAEPAVTETVELHELAAPVLLEYDVSDLAAAGVDPESLQIWTRPDPGGLWQAVPVQAYDMDRQVVSAWLEHFSEFGLGQGLDQSGDLLPNLRSFTADELTGAAQASVPIEAPAGLGGLRPNLALRYSSVTIDDLFRLAGDYDIEAQASSVGVGWLLDGLSYIARVDGNLNDDTADTSKKFALVLDGTRVSITFESGAWHTNPETFASIVWSSAKSGDAHDWGGWTVVTTAGTRYEFGDNTPFADFAFNTANVTSLQRTTGGSTYRLTKRWYLRRITDPLGNSLEYRYRAERQWETCGVSSSWEDNNRNWYTSALDPAEIYWSSNSRLGAGSTLRMQFQYDGAARTDTRVLGNRIDDCIQPMYGVYNRLTAITAQVYSGGAWQTLRRYGLNQGVRKWTRVGQEDKFRLYLDSVDHLGQDGRLLRRFRFGYSFNNPNHIWLTSADNGWSGTMAYSYAGYRVSCSSSACPFGGTRYAVAATTAQDGLGNSVRTGYYFGPASAPGGEWGAVGNDGGFLGFEQADITHYDTNSSRVVKFERLFSFAEGAGASRVNPDPRWGKIKRREIWSVAPGSAGADLLLATDFRWNAYWFENSAWSGPIATSWHWKGDEAYYPPTWVRLESELTTNDTATFEKRYAYEPANQNGYQYGNLTRLEERADGALLRTTVTQFFPNPGANIVAKPARVRVLTPAGACVAEQRSIYDAVDGGYTAAPAAGLLVKVDRALNGCSESTLVASTDLNWSEIRYAYDGYGNQIKVHVVGGGGAGDDLLHTEYDSIYHLFPVRQYLGQEPAMQETARYYGVNGSSLADAGAFWGALQEHCALNRVCTRQSFDEFGRRVRRWERVVQGEPWGSDAAANVQWIYHQPGFHDANQKDFIVTEWRAPRCYGNFTRSHYNGFGQLVAMQTPYQDWQLSVEGCGAGGGGSEIHVYYGYDGLGKPARVSAPIPLSINSWRAATVDWATAAETQTVYDALERATLITAPNGAQTRFSYTGRATSVVAVGRGEPDRLVQWQQRDGLGNLQIIRTYFWNGATWQQDAQMRLGYDALGHLTRVDHPTGAATTLSYDLAGRKTAMTDPDLGGWGYAYNRQGRLTRQTDARGQSICQYFDKVGRLAGKYFVTSPTCPTTAPYYDVSFDYDAGTGALGQITAIDSRDARYAKRMSYDPNGRLVAETVTLAGAPRSYTMRYAYDTFHRLNALTDPDGDTVWVDYNSSGLPGRLRHSRFGVLVNGDRAGAGYADTVEYDAAGRLTAARMPAGGNLWRTWVYAPFGQQDGDGGLLTAVKVGTARGATDRYHLAYGHDSFGNVRRIDENGTPWTFTYDAQNRLVSAYNRTYAYDGAGRLTTYEGAAMTPGSGRTHFSAPTGTYRFDANGNLSYRNGQTLTWDAENHLVALTASGLDERYVYDAGGARVKKSSGGVTTFYPFPDYEVTGSTVTKRYFFAGQPLATGVGGVLSYLHADQVGSPSVATDVRGVQSGTQQYFAYGRKRGGGAFPTDYQFTNHEKDTSGLYYFGARYFDPELGQFVSPDASVADPGNLHDYQRYLYARGNPFRYNDPTGHSPISVDCMCGGGSGEGASDYVRAQGNEMAVGMLQGALDAAGTVDPTPVTDGLNAGIHLARGDRVGAGISGLAMLPFLGDLAKGGRYADEALELARQLSKTDAVADEGQQLLRRLVDMSTHGPVRSSGNVVVLGKFNPSQGYMNYIEKAQEMGAVYFSTPSVEVWNALSDPWQLNRQFLDDAIARGDKFFVEADIAMTLKEKGSYLEREIRYLLKHDYVRQGQRLIKP